MPNKILLVVAGILWRDAHYLAVQRPQGKNHAGLWEFPGGKVEHGESKEQALARELREELAINVNLCHYWRCVEHDYNTAAVGLVQVHFFHVTEFTGEPMSCEGHTLRWVLPHEAVHMPFLEADKGLVCDLMHGHGDI